MPDPKPLPPADPQAGISWLQQLRGEDVADALTGRPPRADSTPDAERELALAALALAAGDESRFFVAASAAKLAGVPRDRLVDLLLLSIPTVGPARAARAADLVRQLFGEGSGRESWQEAMPLAALPDGGGREVTIAGKAIALVRRGERVHAVQAHCPHMRGPLAEGFLEGNELTCPLHSWTFDLAGGECKGVPGASIAIYAVKVEGDRVFVRI